MIRHGMTVERAVRFPRHLLFHYCLRLLATCACVALLAVPTGRAATSPSQEYLANAQQRLQQGDVRAAIIQLRNAVQADPENLDARLALGQLYLRIGEADSAEKELRRVYSARRDDATELLLGQALLALNRSEDVLKIVGEQSADPKLARPKALLRAEAMLNLGRLDEAEKLLGEAPATTDGDATTDLLAARLRVAKGDLAGAKAAVDQALAKSPESIPGWLLAAQIAMASGLPDEAERAAHKALDLSPGNVAAQLMLAEIDFRRGRLEEAQKQALAIREQAPASIPAAYLLANIQAARGQYADADRTLRQISDAIRNFPPALLLSGSVKARVGQLAQAQDLLAHYVSLVPDNRNARRLLAAVQLDAGQARAAADTLASLAGPETQDAASLQLLASAQLRAGELMGARQSFARLAQIGQPAEAQQARSFLTLLDQAAAKPDDAKARAVLLVLDDLRLARLDQALQGAQALVAATPKQPDLMNLLGAVFLARGDDAKAREQFEAALAVDPRFQGALDNLDRLDIRAGQSGKVEERLRRQLAEAPQDEAAVLRLAGLLAGRNDTDAAVALLQDKATALPNSVAVRLALAAIYRARSDQARMLAVADELQAVGARGNPAALEAAGNLYLAGGQADRAVMAFRSLRERQPDNVGAQLLLARAQYVAGDKAGAEATLSQARQRTPGNLIVNNSLVDLRLQSGDTQGALAFAASLAGIDAGQAAQLQAKVLLAAKRGPEAVTLLEKALAAAPSPNLARALFSARVQAGQETAAVESLREWVAAHPDDAASLDLLSQAMIRRTDFAGAAAVAEQAAQLVPTNPTILNNLAWLRHELGQPGAEDLARRAHQLVPNSPEITDTLGWILVRNGKVEEGLGLLREADDGAKNANPDIRYHLAYALQASGQKDAARTILEQLMASDQPFSERPAAEQLRAKLTPS